MAADWGEGKIDGQDLVKRGSLELGLAVTSLIGVGVVGKILQKAITHLPASWRRPVDDFLRGLFTKHRDPLDEPQRLDPLRNGNPSGTGWTRGTDYGPDPQYGLPRTPSSPLNAKNPLPDELGDGLDGIGGSLDDLWGVNPATGKPFTQSEWMDRFSDGSGDIRWPPNGGARAGLAGAVHRPRRVRVGLRQPAGPCRRCGRRLPRHPARRAVRPTLAATHDAR